MAIPTLNKMQRDDVALAASRSTSEGSLGSLWTPSQVSSAEPLPQPHASSSFLELFSPGKTNKDTGRSAAVEALRAKGRELLSAVGNGQGAGRGGRPAKGTSQQQGRRKKHAVQSELQRLDQMRLSAEEAQWHHQQAYLNQMQEQECHRHRLSWRQPMQPIPLDSPAFVPCAAGPWLLDPTSDMPWTGSHEEMAGVIAPPPGLAMPPSAMEVGETADAMKSPLWIQPFQPSTGMDEMEPLDNWFKL
eukprot:gb/GFBE01001247.1/.p1 GENE.gb/GFBE01001247.1/~~gb/GFBE01001247.1/.p1  ORF type:complete len:246 (+),score=50.29 gb/GFBE01001247.1/:1-738(+)